MLNSGNSYMFSCNINELVTFEKKPQKKIFISNSYFIRQIDFKGAGVNQALPCFYGGSLEITQLQSL